MKRARIRKKPKTLELQCRILFRRAILLRDGMKCLRCTTHGGMHKGLQVSHILPKGQYRNLRFEMENAITLCVRHHLYWWHKHPLEAADWITEALGNERMTRLRMLSRARRPKADLKVTKLWLEAQVDRLSKSSVVF